MYQMAAARAVMPSADCHDLRPRLSAAARQESDCRTLGLRCRSDSCRRFTAPRTASASTSPDLRDDALSQGEAHILALLATSGPSTIAELHRGLAHKRSTLTSILDRLAARGFVTRAVGAADRRTFVDHADREGTPRRRSRASSPHGSRAGRRARVSSDDIRGFMKVLAAVEDEAHRRTDTRGSLKSQVSSGKSDSLKSRR